MAGKRRKISAVGIPILARAAVTKRTSFVDSKNVSVSFRTPEFYTDSPSEIIESWRMVKGDSDEIVNPDAISQQIGGPGTFDILSGNVPGTIPLSPRNKCFGFKVKISGNVNLNVGAEIVGTSEVNSLNNSPLQSGMQFNLKAISVDYYQFFAKSQSQGQIVQPLNIMQGAWIPDTVGPPVTVFQQQSRFFGTGPTGLTVQVQLLNGRHPDVISLLRDLPRVRKFLAMATKKYRYLCDEADYDWDQIEFDEDDLAMYDLID